VPRLALIPVLLLAAACARQPAPRQYALTGQILVVNQDGKELVVRHEEIKGFMPAMTMPFRLKDPSMARERVPGDLIRARLLVTDEEAWLEGVEKTGWAPLPERQDSAPPPARLLAPGDAIPDETLIDQDGQAFQVSALQGSAVLLTFIYTRCPLPDFCPRMDAHFGAVQQAIKDGRLRGRIRLLTVSFDPDADTPAVLREHAQRLGADKAVWTFATAPRDRVEAWAGRFGLSVIRDPKDPADISHNLRTAVIDRTGRLAAILDGNRWSPAEAIAALASVPVSWK
jgi:protein SCO1/2